MPFAKMVLVGEAPRVSLNGLPTDDPFTIGQAQGLVSQLQSAISHAINLGTIVEVGGTQYEVRGEVSFLSPAPGTPRIEFKVVAQRFMQPEVLYGCAGGHMVAGCANGKGEFYDVVALA